MKYTKLLAVLMAMTLIPILCVANAESQPIQTSSMSAGASYEHATQIFLNDHGITVDGISVSEDNTAAVYVANDIVYYESSKDFTYGEGSEKDAHSSEEAAAHTVLHIAKPGAYILSGKLLQGQIAVDLGDNAEEDPEAVVTLILNGVDITCEVAPAVIFYNVYECGNDDADKAIKDVDTASAGANVVIVDGSVNNVVGSYVEKIYKPDSVILNEGGTEVEDADKLHKYDAAFYSRQSMNISGGDENTGILNIKAENEGLDSELHLTINGGDIRIKSGNDGINTNEDGISVTTINGGKLTITVSGETGEGDGIDSNGWLVINGGTVIAAACSESADAGIDSDMGIHINGGTVIATGHMLDQIENDSQNYVVLNFAQKQNGGENITLKNQNDEIVCEVAPENVYSVLIFSSKNLLPGTYTLWCDGKQLAGSSGSMMRFSRYSSSDMTPPENRDNMQPPAEDDMSPDGFTPPEDGMSHDEFSPHEGSNSPEGFTPPHERQLPEDFTPPDMGNIPQMPDRSRPGYPGMGNMEMQEQTADIIIQEGGNMFIGVTYFTENSAES